LARLEKALLPLILSRLPQMLSRLFSHALLLLNLSLRLPFFRLWLQVSIHKLFLLVNLLVDLLLLFSLWLQLIYKPFVHIPLLTRFCLIWICLIWLLLQIK
jgi:hypothetical protein